MIEVATNTYRLGSSGHNYYLLRDGDQVTVIDAGCSKEWSKLMAALESAGLTLEAIAGIVATHSHADHFGFARKATEEGVSVSVHADEEARARGTYAGRYAVPPTKLPIFNVWMWKNFFPMVRAGVMKLDHLEQVGTFGDGETLDLPGAPVAIHTPGHTEGHTMFHVPEQGLLFSGDGLVTMDLLGSGVGPQMMDQRFHNDHDRAMQSLDRIVQIEASLILPGHGDPWNGTPADAVALARSA